MGMWGTNSSPMSPAAIFLPPLPPGMPNRAPRRCMAAARTGAEPSRAEPERWVCPRRQRAARATGAERERAWRAGHREGAGTRGRGPAGGGGGALLFLIQWRIAGPAAASGGALRSASRRAPGRGRWRGTQRRRPAPRWGRRASPGGVGSGSRSGRGLPRPRRRAAVGHQHWVFYPKSLGCEKGQLRGSQHKEQDLRFLKPLAFETAEGTSPDWVGVGLPVQIWTWTSGPNPNVRFALRC